MKRGCQLISYFIIVFQLFILCSCNNKLADPRIGNEIMIRNLTNKEYKELGTSTLENPSINDFKKLIFNFEMTHSKNISYRYINVPEGSIWRNRLDSIDGERYWFGSEFKQDNADERFVKYHKEIIFYSKGITNEQIRAAFESIIIRVSYEKTNGKSYTIESTIDNLIHFSAENNK